MIKFKITLGVCIVFLITSFVNAQSSCLNPTIVTCGSTLTNESTIGQGDNIDYDGTCVTLNPNNGEDMVYAITPVAGITEIAITLDNIVMTPGFPTANLFETYIANAASCDSACLQHIQFTENGVINGGSNNTAIFTWGAAADGLTTFYIVIDEQLTGGNLQSYDITFNCISGGVSLDTDGCGGDAGLSSSDGHNESWNGAYSNAVSINSCGETGTFCTEFWIENPAWEWVNHVEMTLGPCWDVNSITNATPTSGSWYDTGGNWAVTIDSLNNSIIWDFTDSGGSAWGDGDSDNQNCVYYEFCFDATVLPSCSNQSDLNFTITVSDDGVSGSGSTVATFFNYNTNFTLTPGPMITGNVPVCEGQNITLTGSGTPNPVIPWTSSDPSVATISNAGVVTGIAQGVTTITYTDNTGCQVQEVLGVVPTPTLSGNGPVCEGATLQLTGSGTPGPGTPWSSSDIAVATVGATGLVTSITVGSSTITYTNDAGCSESVIVTINTSNTGTDVQTACTSYTWPLNGTVYTASTNTPTVTLTNTAGCDSVVTLDLTINTPNTGTDVQTACITYTWPLNGTTYTASTNTPTVTLTNAAGCDSVVTLDLTINNSNTVTDIQTACDSYTWPLNGTVYTASTNTPTVTLTNAAGCDSVVTLDLTINTFATGTDVQIACVSYTWIDGNTYTSSNNTATHTIPNGSVNGCDSVVTLDLTINTPTTGTDIQTACDTFTWIDNITYFASTNTPTFTLVGGTASGCDSLVTLDLTIITCPLPIAAYIVSDSNICIGECVDFTDQSTGATAWQWTFNGGTPATSNTQNPGTVCYNTAGTYTVKQVVTNTFGADSITTQIIVNALPLIIASPDVTIKLGESTILTAAGTSGSYTWSPPIWLDCPTCAAPVSTPEETITYTVSVVDDNGCIATDEVTVILDYDYIVWVPNIFSPNGDGSNDIFTIVGTNLESVEGEIFNRWGQKMFGWNNVKGYWDGRTLSGSEASAGTYFYIITVKGIDEVEHLKKGSFTLIR